MMPDTMRLTEEITGWWRCFGEDATPRRAYDFLGGGSSPMKLATLTMTFEGAPVNSR